MRKHLKRHEMAELMRMSKSQLRFYEKKGILKPDINDKGYAMYIRLATMMILLVKRKF